MTAPEAPLPSCGWEQAAIDANRANLGLGDQPLDADAIRTCPKEGCDAQIGFVRSNGKYRVYLEDGECRDVVAGDDARANQEPDEGPHHLPGVCPRFRLSPETRREIIENREPAPCDYASNCLSKAMPAEMAASGAPAIYFVGDCALGKYRCTLLPSRLVEM